MHRLLRGRVDSGRVEAAHLESIVRDLSKERLLDGQFDECKLTLRELHEIEDAIIGRLRSIRHQRLAYPEDQEEAGSSESSS